MKEIQKAQYMGRKRIYYSCLDSTNNFFIHRIHWVNGSCEGFEEGTLVLTEIQKEGRGQRGQKWISKKGKSLIFSILLKPELVFLPQLSQIMALSLCKTILYLSKRQNLQPKMKWPNDLMLREKKWGGILCESHKNECVTLGVGINVNLREYDFPRSIREKSTSLYLETGKNWSRELLLNCLMDQFEENYEQWLKEGFWHFVQAMQSENEYGFFYLAGKYVVVHQNGTGARKLCQGKVLGLNEMGYLLVKDSSGKMYSISSGHVHVVDD